MKVTLNHSIKSYVNIFIVGIIVGCICRLTDFCPSDSLWSFSSTQTLLGFWIISNTIIVLLSTSNICSGLSSFLYMLGMTLSFYGLQAILGLFIPLYRPDYARNQNDGGNGLGLYIVASVLDSLKLAYSLEPMQKPLGMRFTITF